ncbi:efflux RND transporter permease subunit [Leeuwenhoekiella marinoflava]|uniref:Hydrophobe/amphiphile efflux-1 (HAE1) family protein n=2 Tax=Leeuwenhoekiella marinoflava TaxID=988 RepID=A0A4Q0PP06_9FLAO|nr:multidrug efflux RND transporter permease subunit [Leeuwenhoekiella marinoflava]RXG32257.1 hydrophobe/amphiphile efflux-1 (HAE1) family protein [Leeuwenhoekiella marinoflava]SHE81613.1 hydrophobe/amphiphile efflux-1 (HAE1) family protein [Leeuwenhoekiella marinoflava DSM 3653]
MKFSHIFIQRPIFAGVLSVLILIVGALAYVSLPISQFPDVAPPTVEVVATYPGANARTLSETVAAPLEKEINGVEGMLYMTSQSSADGRVIVQVAFELGTDLDRAQVQVQNRVAIAEPRLPEASRRLGITTKKISPDILLVVNMYSPNKTYDQTYMGNYAALQLKDELARIKGIGDIQIFGAAEYAMRIWLDPDKISNLDMTAGEVVASLRAQNVQIASGTLNTLPSGKQAAFEINIQTQGKLVTTEQFENVILKSNEGGRLVRLKDVGRVELGAQNYATTGYLGKDPAIAMPVFQQPGGNALETSAEIEARMEELSKSFPKDLEYKIAYNPTKFIQKSVDEVYHTIFEAIILVVLVILLFLQSWRAAIIPILAIPVSLIGTFAVMQAIGFSLNNLTLFGLVLAIGIVVDDAIVVVENMERYLAQGFAPKEAARKTMDEVGGALVAIGLVLIAVFIPTAFLDGISGQFYKQFGMTIAVATAISVFVSLTLSPAMAALLMKHEVKDPNKKTPLILKPFAYVGNGFNRFIDKISASYGKRVQKLVRTSIMVLVVYGGLIIITGFEFGRVPKGFIPAMDQQYFITLVQLPPGASLSRTDAVVKDVIDKALDIDGVENAIAFTGFDAASNTNSSNTAAVFLPLEDFEIREEKGLEYEELLGTISANLGQIDDAIVLVIPPPSVRGIGNAGGFRMMVQDRANLGTDELVKATYALAAAANADPILTNVFTFFNDQTPQLYLDIDRVKAEKLGINVGDVFQSLEIYMGSAFVNEFNYLGRTFQVTAQADAPNRLTPDDISRIKVRNADAEMVPLGTFTKQEDISGASRIPRFNLFPAASLNGNIAPGYSSGEALDRMEELAAEVLPQGISFEWTELAYQEKQTGNTAGIAFLLAVVFVFLLLAAQFESLVLPLAVIFIVPMVLLSAIVGIDLAGLDNNIMVQIGLIVLVGLASKNAILIVEFAKQLEDQGKDLKTAVIEASRLRLRPILMTAMAFILGVIPLAIATGAGAELRVSLGIAVFSGMLGVTIFGIFLTPVFYYLGRKWTTQKAKEQHEQ